MGLLLGLWTHTTSIPAPSPRSPGPGLSRRAVAQKGSKMPHVSERWGPLSMVFTCPGCGWEGTIRYTRRQPVYCSNACKQKAYRKRQKDKEAKNVTTEADKAVTNLSKHKIERALDQVLHLMRCGCKRGIWTVRGNIQAGGLRCDLCGDIFQSVEHI